MVQRDGKQLVLRLDAVRYGDTMLVCREAKASSFKGSRSVGIRTRVSERIACTSDRTSLTVARAWATFTSRFGKPNMATFPPAGMYITGTGILSTTSSTTWNASPSPSMWHSTWTPSVESKRDSMRTRFGRLLRLGTRRPRAVRGTASTAALHGRRANPYPAYASTAVQSSNASPGVTLIASAPTTASRRGGERQGSTTKGEIARSAGKRFESTSIPGNTVAPVRVVANRAAGSSLVHNLTVYGHAEYFANGALVLNCLDALRYIVMARPLKPDPEVPKPNETMKDRLLRHHLKRLRKPPAADNGFGPGIFA